MAPAVARARRRRLPLLLAWLLPSASLAAGPQRPVAGAAGRAAVAGRGAAGAGLGSGTSLSVVLEPGSDKGLDPRGDDYRPRPGPGEDGHDAWAFGKAHAALHHVLESAPAGEPKAALAALEAFSAEHNLSFGLGPAYSSVLAAAVGEAVAAASEEAERGQQAGGLAVLALGPGLGGPLLHCLPALLGPEPGLRGSSATASVLVHELVSVQGDEHLSSGSQRLVAHALGEGELQERVRHTPLLAEEDTTLEEVLETLRDGYELPAFDLVVLEGGCRDRQRRQLDSLLRSQALREGAVVHAEGPSVGQDGPEELLERLQKGSSRFEARVKEAGPGRSAVVATYRGRTDSSEL